MKHRRTTRRRMLMFGSATRRDCSRDWPWGCPDPSSLDRILEPPSSSCGWGGPIREQSRPVVGAGKIPPPYLWLRLVPLVRLLVCYGIEMWHLCSNEKPSLRTRGWALSRWGEYGFHRKTGKSSSSFPKDKDFPKGLGNESVIVKDTISLFCETVRRGWPF